MLASKLFSENYIRHPMYFTDVVYKQGLIHVLACMRAIHRQQSTEDMYTYTQHTSNYLWNSAHIHRTTSNHKHIVALQFLLYSVSREGTSCDGALYLVSRREVLPVCQELLAICRPHVQYD